ncbi:50S ribosomal protein L37Ae [uncultured archaeon]|nr:50S ribosomal protein L37Ae [uncultured archaeon]
MKTKKVKAAGRFNARYGRSVRLKITEIESIQRKKQNCIFCNKVAKRVSKGIWYCKGCNKKFASHTYYLPKKEEVNLNNPKNNK